MNAEQERLRADAQRQANWKRWGPYLSERQWGTVREDYSPGGTCWEYFPHDHARSRAYRWGEDGLLGFADRECRLCFGLALWNGADSMLKERLFGLSNPEGNHGEDVKEQYFYLDSTPTHSYCKVLYKYPQAAFPYDSLLTENRRRTRADSEFELLDTTIFDDGRYFDVLVEYAKNSPDDLLIRLTVTNCGPEPATLHLLPTLWFRNTWSWHAVHDGVRAKPRLEQLGPELVGVSHETLGELRFAVEPSPPGTRPVLLFTENETNRQRLWQADPDGSYTKDAFHEWLIRKDGAAVNPNSSGTKAAVYRSVSLTPGGTHTMRLRLFPLAQAPAQPFDGGFERTFTERIREANEFYGDLAGNMEDDPRNVVRQGYAGLLWSKQFYHYIVRDWLEGDPGVPPPAARGQIRNGEWEHVYSRDIILMPDKWEYPWFASWDLAFHTIPMARIDPDFAKGQLLLLLREWYLHPNGQLPAYEFAFGDVNPPVHAWAAWRVYKISAARGERDRDFLESVFQKLLLNFTWWVNRKDVLGKNLFSGGFLGLDNIGVFDRSKPLPTGGTLQQADGTAWMAFYCATMLSMAVELAETDGRVHPAYEDMASKFLEHFVQIADAMNRLGEEGLWDEEDGFYYDQIRFDHSSVPLKVRSLVGLLPLITVEVYEIEKLNRLPGFSKRLAWFRHFRQDLPDQITHFEESGPLRLLAVPSRARLERLLGPLLDEAEFLSPFGIRSLSKFHQDHPFQLKVNGDQHQVDYEPGESRSGLFGGNSNWRGPVWFPFNYLIIEALERYHRYYGDTLQVQFPTRTGPRINLRQVSSELSRRLTRLLLRNDCGQRPAHGTDQRWAVDPHWRDLVLFYEFFHGETGQGLGANHQTGWTSLVIRQLEDQARGT